MSLLFDLWKCDTCADKPEFESTEAMKTHLVEVHKMDMKTTKFSKKMLCHLDGAKFFQSDYRYTGGGVDLFNSVRHSRDKSDPLYF